MKITKKQRKQQNGMNAATKQAYETGYRPPVFAGKDGQLIGGTMVLPFSKLQRGVPYVNPENFGL